MGKAFLGSGLHPDRGIPGWRRHSDGSESRDTRSKTSLGTIEISSEHSAVPGRSELPTNSDRDGRFPVLIRPDLPGRTMARIGLRMMPPFPWSPLKFRTAGFPQYDFKAGRCILGMTIKAGRAGTSRR